MHIKVQQWTTKELLAPWNNHSTELCTETYGKILGGNPKILFPPPPQFSQNIDGFRLNNSQGF